MYRILFLSALFAMACAMAQAATSLDVDTKALAKEKLKEVETEVKINKRITKEDKYIAHGPMEFEDINKENKKRIDEFSRPNLPNKKKDGNAYVY